MADTYILQDGAVVPAESPKAWVAWMRAESRVMAKGRVGRRVVVTRFGGVDMRPIPDPRRPLVFETATIEGGEVLGVVRSSSWSEALAAHGQVVQELRKERARSGAPRRRPWVAGRGPT